MRGKMGCAVALFIILLVALLNFLVSAGIVYVLSICFGFTFTWKLALGIFILMCLASSIFGNKLSK